MKILFHLNSMGHGGAERVVSILSAHLAGQGEKVVVATQWYSKEEYSLHEKVRRINLGLTKEEEQRGRLYKALLRLFRLRQCIRRERPQLVISFCCKANYRSAVSLLFCKTPLLISVRNDPSVDYAENKAATWLLERKAKGCVFQTPDARAFFSEKLQKKSRIILNPIADCYLVKKQEGAAAFPPEKQVIVTVGRISGQKNQLLLVRAFAVLCREFPDAVLRIYGDVQEEEVYRRLTAFIEEEGLKEKVFFMGVTDKLKQEMADASLFVLPSDYEGMPNALIEAMAMGLPVIATDCPCGGPSMLIEDGKNGRLIPVGGKKELEEAMRVLLREPEKAFAMGKEAEKIIQRVHPEKICEEWMDYIRELLS